MTEELSTIVNSPLKPDRSKPAREHAVENKDHVHATPDERVDEAIDESFPASDPPSWNAEADNDAT